MDNILLRIELLCGRIFFGLISRVARFRFRRHLDVRGPLRLSPRVAIRSRNLGFKNRPQLMIITAGQNSLGNGVVIQGTGRFLLGQKSYLADYCVIGCNDEIRIGCNVMVASSVTIRDTDHGFERIDTPMYEQGITTAPVRIEDDVWIGHGAAILKGVTVGRGAIVAAGAVVNRDVAPFSIVGGVPARVIGNRKNPGL
jgi:acetyltransferase-like isoleucine patch superfamily enzyme